MNNPTLRVVHDGLTIEMVGCFAIDLKELIIITLLESKMMKGDKSVFKASPSLDFYTNVV